jgi:hypothetical protein
MNFRFLTDPPVQTHTTLSPNQMHFEAITGVVTVCLLRVILKNRYVIPMRADSEGRVGSLS